MKNSPIAALSDRHTEVESLVGQLRETEARLQALTGGDLDAVLFSDGSPHLLHEAQKKLRQSEGVQRDLATQQSSILNALPANIALLDHRGVIVSVNNGWREYAGGNGLRNPDFGLGTNYIEVCEQVRGAFADEAQTAAAGIRAVLTGEKKSFTFDYACHTATEKCWYRLRVNPLEKRGRRGAVVMHLDITASKLAEEALRESEGHFRDTFEQAAVGIAHVAPMGPFLRVNSKLCEIFGYSHEELSALTLAQLILPEDRVAWEEAKMDLLAGRRLSHSEETRFCRKNGQSIWVALLTTCHKSTRGETEYFISVFQDISSRKEAEVSLRRSQAMLRMAGRLTRMGAWSVDVPGGKVTWSDEVCAIHEMIPGFEPAPADAINYFAPEFRDAYQRAFRACASDGVPFDLELQIVTSNGHHVWVRSSGEAERADEGGCIVAVRGALQDISDRKTAEMAVREQAALIDQANDAIIVRGLDHNILFWSKGAERIYGWTAAEAVGRTAGDLLTPDPSTLYDAYDGTLRNGAWSGEIEVSRKDGRRLKVDTRWTLLKDIRERPKSILVIATDVTEQRKLQEQFLRTQRMESIGTLAGGIAHDLNNLLAPVTMGAGLLRQLDPSPQMIPIIQSIEQSAKRGAALVKQVLSFARGIEGSKIALQARNVIREIESIAESTFPKNVIFKTDVSKDLWLIMADPTQLNQILLNLCVNARDAMPGGGKIELTARNVEIDVQYASMNPEVPTGRYVMFQVADNGTGMPKEIIDRIFEPFFTTKKVGKGSGLGLSTVLGIVKSHKGYVTVSSKPGQGSVFNVYLPANVEGVAAEKSPDSGMVKLPRGNGELVMVVDDESSIRDITKQTLETFGYRVVTAEDGAHAISVYAQQAAEIGVVLTDVMMPVMDGLALIAALRRVNPNVRIVAASGLASNTKSSESRVSNANVRYFLAKPYSAEPLLQILKSALTEDPGS